MARENAATPLILWVCAAVCAHYVLGQGGNEVARAHDDASFFAKMGYQARGKAREAETTIELGAAAETPVAPTETDTPAPALPKPAAEAKKDPTPEAKKPDEPKKEEPKKIAILPKPTATPAPVTPPPPMQKDQRIAVKQHVKPDQQDNATAKFIADEANKVDKETVATQTAHDQDDPNPTPAGQHAGPTERTGDSQRTRIADSEDRKGEKNRAPGDKGTEFDIQVPTRPAPGQVAMLAPKTPANNPGGDGRPPSASSAAAAQEPGGASQATPAVAEGAKGWTFDPARPGGFGAGNQGGASAPNRTATGPAKKASSGLSLGLGAQAAPGQVNLNLNQRAVVATIGHDQLHRERVADGERRKSEHRGAFQASNFERWRSAIENYVTTVKPGNQTALNAARVPFATYLNTIHNRLHPIFADSFLGSLDGLPSTHPLSNPRLITHLEIVVGPQDGQIVKMGVVKASGVTAFDIAALDSVKRASPFGPAPKAIVSSDGNVYLHWEFHRDEVYACSTMNARPFLLNLPPAAPPAEAPPARPTSPTDEGRPPPGSPNELRHGAP
ncbi:MAG TPA: energy transducer TonB [Polyangiaceae bacterium]|nr:energy transducer TonB [Polyangiaceae bacterium]